MEASSLSRNRGESLGTEQSIRMGIRCCAGRCSGGLPPLTWEKSHKPTIDRQIPGFSREFIAEPGDSAVTSRIRLQE